MKKARAARATRACFITSCLTAIRDRAISCSRPRRRKSTCNRRTSSRRRRSSCTPRRTCRSRSRHPHRSHMSRCSRRRCTPRRRSSHTRRRTCHSRSHRPPSRCRRRASSRSARRRRAVRSARADPRQQERSMNPSTWVSPGPSLAKAMRGPIWTAEPYRSRRCVCKCVNSIDVQGAGPRNAARRDNRLCSDERADRFAVRRRIIRRQRTRGSAAGTIDHAGGHPSDQPGRNL